MQQGETDKDCEWLGLLAVSHGLFSSLFVSSSRWRPFQWKRCAMSDWSLNQSYGLANQAGNRVDLSHLVARALSMGSSRVHSGQIQMDLKR